VGVSGPGNRWPLPALVVGFAVSTLLWERAGIRFRADTLDYFAQLLDPPLLRDRLLESLWHLHAQPPAFNLLAGLALKAAPDAPATILRPVFLLAGLAAGVAAYVALRALGLARPLAVGLALAFVSTPTFAIYEHWAFYPHLALACVAIAAAAFLRAGAGSRGALSAGFAALGVLSLTRSLYPFAYLAIAAAAAAALVPAGRRRAALLAALPAAGAVALWSLKNLVLFGFFGTSSWGGNSLHRMMTESLPAETVRAMVARGELSPISAEWEFSPPGVFAALLAPDGRDTGIPALDRTTKTRARENSVNYNHWIYPRASREYRKGALRMMRAHPGAYFASIRWTARRYLDPVTDDHFLRPIRFPVRGAVAPFEAAERSVLVRIAVAAALLGALVRLASGRGPRAERLFLAFALGTIAWGSALGILAEYGENNRFRWHLSPLVFLLVVTGVRDVARAVTRGGWRLPRARSRSPGSSPAGRPDAPAPPGPPGA